jgi:hypothetical protein
MNHPPTIGKRWFAPTTTSAISRLCKLVSVPPRPQEEAAEDDEGGGGVLHRYNASMGSAGCGSGGTHAWCLPLERC